MTRSTLPTPLAWTILVMLLFVTIEFMSFVAILWLPDRELADFRARIDALTEEQIARARDSHFDANLGWNTRASQSLYVATNASGERFEVTTGPDGSRTNATPYTNQLITAYGDSFTLGYEVNDDETWPHFLSLSSRSHVVNRGVSSFSADQSFLKFSRDEAVDTPYVLLAYIWADFERSLASYHRYQNPWSPHATLFKPRIRFEEGEAIVEPNPLRRLESRADVFDALIESQETDLYYRNYWRWFDLRFPFSVRAWMLLSRRLENNWVRATSWRPRRVPFSCTSSTSLIACAN